MTLRQKNLGPVDASQDGEEMINMSQSVVAQTGTRREFTETGQYRKGASTTTSRSLTHCSSNRHQPLRCTSSMSQPTKIHGPWIGQNIQFKIREGGPSSFQRPYGTSRCCKHSEKGMNLETSTLSAMISTSGWCHRAKTPRRNRARWFRPTTSDQNCASNFFHLR